MMLGRYREELFGGLKRLREFLSPDKDRAYPWPDEGNVKRQVKVVRVLPSLRDPLQGSIRTSQQPSSRACDGE